MSSEPMMLVCTRLADMTMMHPEQTQELCSQCQHVVGVYPTGQRAMIKHPQMKVICIVCASKNAEDAGKVGAIPAGSWEEIIQETRESKPVGKA